MTDHEWRTAASEPVSRVTRSRQGPRAAGAHRSRTRFGLPRVGSVRKPAKVLALAIAALTVVGGIATAAVIAPGTNGPGLTSVGPVSATDGFPVWYKDKTGLRLENCIAQADPLCPARGPLPDETAPISFPDNYPDEGFYTLTNANLNVGTTGKALLVLALEQAFSVGPVIDGDQVTFARLRLKITDATDGVDYKFTTPAGVKTLQTSKPGLVFDTEDIGIGGKGDFTGALGGRVGPFLTWDTYPSDPALKPDAAGKDTYVGDGATAHKIKGSPYDTNVFRIEGPGVNSSPTVDACPTVTGPIADCIETDLFTVQGKLATTSGVTAEQATYSRSSTISGSVDVYASSETGPQSIQVSDASGGAAKFDPTGLQGSAGHYFARVGYDGGQPPAKLQVTNVGDVPVSSKVINVVDKLTGTATWDADKNTVDHPGGKLLTVNAVSSDTAVARTLTVTGYGPLTSGTYVSDQLDAPPATVTVTSDAGGSAVLPVSIVGAAYPVLEVVAQAGPDQTVIAGQSVTLDGSASIGAKSFAWTGPAGITISGANTATPTFTAPTTVPADPLSFTLTVDGPGGPKSATVSITVTAASAPVANAGADQSAIKRGTKVTLNGSGSTGAATYTWTQVVNAGDPTVTLTGANTPQPSFTFPLYKFPATPGALTFNLKVANPDGTLTSNDQVSIAPANDTVTITKALYTASKKEWRIDGTSSVPAGGQNVTVHLGALGGPVIGSPILVDATGAWSVRVTVTTATPPTGQTVSAESQLGGTVAGFVAQIK
jgi:hypothetical protein